MTNSLIWAVTDPVDDPSAETIYSIARRVRQSIERTRDPGYAAAYDAAHSPIAIDIANKDMAQNFTQPPGHWVINSTWKSVSTASSNGIIWALTDWLSLPLPNVGLIGRRHTLATKAGRGSSTPSSTNLGLRSFSNLTLLSTVTGRCPHQQVMWRLLSICIEKLERSLTRCWSRRCVVWVSSRTLSLFQYNSIDCVGTFTIDQ